MWVNNFKFSINIQIHTIYNFGIYIIAKSQQYKKIWIYKPSLKKQNYLKKKKNVIGVCDYVERSLLCKTCNGLYATYHLIFCNIQYLYYLSLFLQTWPHFQTLENDSVENDSVSKLQYRHNCLLPVKLNRSINQCTPLETKMTILAYLEHSKMWFLNTVYCNT